MSKAGPEPAGHRPRPARDDREHREQAALFEWARLAVTTRPELDMLFAVPNGGQRHPAVAAKMKREDQRAGIPDIFLDVPRQGFHGLRIELKAPGGPGQEPGRLKPEQLEWLNALNANGYKAVPWGWESTRETILNYLGNR